MLAVQGTQIPRHLDTDTLRDGMRYSDHPERAVMFLAVAASDRRWVEATATYWMLRDGIGYTDALQAVVVRYLTAKHRKETSWTSTSSSTGRTLGTGGTGRRSGSQLWP